MDDARSRRGKSKLLTQGEITKAFEQHWGRDDGGGDGASPARDGTAAIDQTKACCSRKRKRAASGGG
ncbi:MAG TPA: hypothetical protein VM221_07565 [Armatimonadota bacterium]|nr:hypothetical protein [Armatimonadota bacterium]